MQETPYTFKSNGNQIVGMVHHPAGPEKRTALLMCHGFTGNKCEANRLFVDAARDFATSGFHTERFDFFGSGDSSGAFHETRISINIQNLKDAIIHIKESGCEKLVILGISMGAATAILAADGQPIDGLILWSTVPDMEELFLSRIGDVADSLDTLERLEYEGWLIEKDFYLDAVQYDILDCFEKLLQPKLIVQGSGDGTVFTKGFDLFKKAASGKVDFQFLDGAGHTYETVRHRRLVIETSRDWLLQHFD